MHIGDFDFVLPKKLIAQKPKKPRSLSKIIIQNKLKITFFKNLYNYLPKNSLLVFNNTKVIPTILEGHIDFKKIKVTLYEKLKNNNWKVFLKPGKKAKSGSNINFGTGLNGVIQKTQNYSYIKFNISDEKLKDYLYQYAEFPIPPYIKTTRNKVEDEQNYQTIFAENRGAYAAPTAGLHFDKELMENLKQNDIDTAFVTLHVGAGTFLPLKNEIIENNILHYERGIISRSNANKINQAIKNERTIIAVGTTVVRLLEGCYKKYEKIKYFNENTNIFIYPGFKFNVVDSLITNFHLPKSSLLLLVAAFAGKEEILKIYSLAIKKNLRFFTYGDAMLLKKKNEI